MWSFCTEQLRATDERAGDMSDDKKDTDVSLLIVVGVCNSPKVTAPVRPMSRPFNAISVIPIPKVIATTTSRRVKLRNDMNINEPCFLIVNPELLISQFPS